MALAYVALVVVLFETRARRALNAFAPVGRMALTHYLGQILLGAALFYGAGGSRDSAPGRPNGPGAALPTASASRCGGGRPRWLKSRPPYPLLH